MDYTLTSSEQKDTKLLLTVDQAGAEDLVISEKEKSFYDVKNAEGVVQYRIVNIARGPLQNVNNSSSSTNSNPIQGCQFYVINELNEEHSNLKPGKPIPRRQPVYTSRKQRDEEKKATHKEVERRRRDRMNKLLSRLKDQLPDTAGAGSCNADSKVSILVKACEYIEKMQEKDNSFIVCLEENEKLERENRKLKVENEKLRKDIQRLTEMVESKKNVKQEKV